MSKLEMPIEVTEDQSKEKIPLWKRILPLKGDGIAEIMRKSVFIASILVLIGCAVYFVNMYLTIEKDKSDISEIIDIKNSGKLSIDWEDGTGANGNKSAETGGERVPREILPEYAQLYEINNDMVGWFALPEPQSVEMVIDYPVVQYSDNSFYLEHNFYKESSISGTVFADYNIKITEESQPHNIILHGHNFLAGTYFARLTAYESVDFYKEHPLVQFDTLYERNMYKVFAAMLIDVEEPDETFFYYHKKYEFKSQDDFNEYIVEVMDRSYFYTPVDLQYGDELLTLSTCSKRIDDYGRFVVFARKVRDGESNEVAVDGAVQNPNPKFFQKYYEIWGGWWEGRIWNPALLKGYEPEQ